MNAATNQTDAQKAQEAKLDKTLDHSFPASDPPSRDGVTGDKKSSPTHQNTTE